MSVNPGIAGRCYPPSPPYHVGREMIRAFAQAVWADDPAHHDLDAARRHGYGDLVAPPTFVISVSQRVEFGTVVADPEAGIDFSRVLHADQRFTHVRPIVAGDALSVAVEVSSVRRLGGNDMVGIRSTVTDASGETVAVVSSTMLVRGEEGEAR
ncbi:FAS1-like dehydratase domain-containing protein [Micrococcus luteus]|uniref:FAS1-like dehydratase domain-containing protein n=1 Tax=Micrococcus luteus TaxID=1270 RepID=UPI0020CEF64F|nr:MaoC family dehydratase N-terminal domain-containing protein [Micrococcus luteus]UTT45152.1 MaoC family dehydratase N-terminal domain-containing protein [Micrococcus luteus]